MPRSPGHRPWYMAAPLRRLDSAGKRLDSWPLLLLGWIALSVGPAWVGLVILNDESVDLPLVLRLAAWAMCAMSVGTFLFLGRVLARDISARQKRVGR